VVAPGGELVSFGIAGVRLLVFPLEVSLLIVSLATFAVGVGVGVGFGAMVGFIVGGSEVVSGNGKDSPDPEPDFGKFGNVDGTSVGRGSSIRVGVGVGVSIGAGDGSVEGSDFFRFGVGVGSSSNTMTNSPLAWPSTVKQFQ
jgi:hypothetical protein